MRLNQLKPHARILLLLFFLLLAGTGCSPANTATIIADAPAILPTSTITPDPCGDELKVQNIQEIEKLMKHFDDFSMLAQSTPREQLAVVVIEMTNSLYEIENYPAPVCLEPLKQAQLNYVQAVITTMTDFLGGAPNDQINAQINASREIRQSYEIEHAAQLGISYSTPTPMPTFTVTPIIPTSTPSPVTVSADQDMYVLQGPAISYPAIGTLLVGQTVNATGRSEDRQWVQIELSDQPGILGWVPEQLIKLNGYMSDLPEVAAPPVEQ